VKGGNFTGLAHYYQLPEHIFLRFSFPEQLKQPKTLHNLAIFDVAIDNFIDIFLINIGVPDTFRINYTNRSLLATIKATGLINPDFTLTGHTQRLYPVLCIISQIYRSTLIAGRPLGARPAIIGAEKYMSLVVLRHGHLS
jgi:hypothetical protein